MDQRKRKISQGIRKVPPPCFATIRGNRQILPVPTARPTMEISKLQRELNCSSRSLAIYIDPAITDIEYLWSALMKYQTN